MNLKNAFLTIMFLLSLVVGQSQDCVDIQITKQTSKSVTIDLYPQSVMKGVLSSVVFSLKWTTGGRMAFGIPTSNIPGLVLSRSGDPIEKDGETYQIFAGFGNQPRTPSMSKVTITIPVQGRAELSISDDEFIRNVAKNGGYYVSIGGLDRTGQVLQKMRFNDEIYSDNVIIFPNPPKGDITIDISKMIGPLVVIQIYDIQGKEVLRRTESVSDGGLKLNISLSQPPGIYILAVYDNNKVHKSKFVLENS